MSDVSSENLDIHPVFENHGNSETTRRNDDVTGFINLREYGLLDRNISDIIKSIAKENSPEIQPIFAFKLPKAIKLIFATKESRDKAYERKLNIMNIRVEIEMPRQPNLLKNRTIHLYGFPIEEKLDDIEKFVKNLSVNVGSEMKWITWPETKIRNGGRSYIVSCNKEKEIPGYSTFYSTIEKRPIDIQIWYYGIEKWCRKCKGKGHFAKDCSNIDDIRPRNPNSYAAKVAGNVNSSAATKVITTSVENVAKTTDDHQMETLQSKSVQQCKPTEELSEILPFYGKESFLSNDFLCAITVHDERYKSPEHYLFKKKADAMGDLATAKTIMRAKTAAGAKSAGEKIKWIDGDHGDWKVFAGMKLREANEVKYRQNASFRKKFFETAPKVLIEASETDTYWGVGLKSDDPDIQQKEKWRGENKFGELLMRLRDELMEEYKNEIDVDKSDEESGRDKRRLSSDGDQPITKANRTE